MHAPCIGIAHRMLPLCRAGVHTPLRWWGDYSWYDVLCTYFNLQRMSVSPRNSAIPDWVQPQIRGVHRPRSQWKEHGSRKHSHCSILVLSGEWDQGNLTGSAVMEEDQVWGCRVVGLHARFVVIRT